MAQTFLFEELDGPTRDYLTAVRDSNGQGAPGVFTFTSSAMAGCGCISGILIVVATLVLTLTSMTDVVHKAPERVALLQTAGFLLGGWLVFAGMRSGNKGNKTMAGHWLYIDPLHIYQGYRETVTVTPVNDVVEATYTHNYNDGSYQNSVVRALLSSGAPVSVTLNNELRAEQMVTFLNYLAWARGPEGGERASLSPDELGALAKYVAENDAEPKNHEGNIDMKLTSVDITGVPVEPKREGHATPAFLPYVVILIAGIATFFLMKEAINPPIHDDAIFEAVIHEPCEPWFLQMYLLDENNTRHRQQVKDRLAKEYNDAITNVRTQPGGDPKLRDGMVKILESLKETVRPVVSLSVSEVNAKAGAEDRVKKFRDELVGKVIGLPNDNAPTHFDAHDGIMGKMAKLMPSVNPIPPVERFDPPRTPRGIQLIEFASKPEDAAHAHFEITYEFVPDDVAPAAFHLKAKVEIRTDLDGNPVTTYTEETKEAFTPDKFDTAIAGLRDRLLAGLVGAEQGPAFGGNPNLKLPNIKIPNFNPPNFNPPK
ncbi:MAG: hypothetical protein U0792_13405 [Gemmataceae bacterium]